jgi:hypothetical protein
MGGLSRHTRRRGRRARRALPVGYSSGVQRFLIIAGIVCVVLGLSWPWLARAGWWRWIGRLPGDLHFEREGFSFHFPLMTSIVLSIVISLIVWFLRK